VGQYALLAQARATSTAVNCRRPSLPTLRLVASGRRQYWMRPTAAKQSDTTPHHPANDF